MQLRKRIKRWLANKFADKTIIDANKILAESLKDQDKQVRSLQHALIAVQEKMGGEIATLYHLIKAQLVKEPEYQITISGDLLQTTQELPDIDVVVDDNGSVILKFKEDEQE